MYGKIFTPSTRRWRGIGPTRLRWGVDTKSFCKFWTVGHFVRFPVPTIAGVRSVPQKQYFTLLCVIAHRHPGLLHTWVTHSPSVRDRSPVTRVRVRVRVRAKSTAVPVGAPWRL